MTKTQENNLCRDIGRIARSLERIARAVEKPDGGEKTEVIRCKDCKHHWTYKCMDSMPLEVCDLDQTFYDANIDYCSLAERREVTE